MVDTSPDPLLDYYQLELNYLRVAGARLADKNPTLAKRLALSEHECPDPHVERLLEAFAFLTAKVHQSLDDDYTQLTNDLLEQLYPFAVRPTPSVAVVRFQPKARHVVPDGGELIARDTQLSGRAEDATSILFSTTSEVKLWPLKVTGVTLQSSDDLLADGHGRYPSALVISMERQEGCKTPLDALPIKSLRFHLGGTPNNAAQLFDMLIADAVEMEISAESDKRHFKAMGGLPQASGFAEHEALYPVSFGVHPALRVMAEYCACPHKFSFVEIPLQIPTGEAEKFAIRILLKRAPQRLLSLVPADLQLGCTPAINLFLRTAEPLRPDGTRREYRIVPDAYRDHAIEAYAVQQVLASNGPHARKLPPYHSCADGMEQGPWWHVRRVTSVQWQGSELMLTLVDPNFEIMAPPQSSLTIQLWCTNRHQAEKLLPNSTLDFEQPGPEVDALFSRAPTSQRPAALAGASRWRLISQLALNNLSIVEGPEALKALQELLKVHDVGDDQTLRKHIAGITQVRSTRVVKHVGSDAWRGWRNGLELRVSLDPQCFVGHSAVLFVGVLAQFFAMYAAPNCFIQTVLEDSNQETIKTWEAIQGQGLVL
jgi:type VI secretion system protein ImpG